MAVSHQLLARSTLSLEQLINAPLRDVATLAEGGDLRQDAYPTGLGPAWDRPRLRTRRPTGPASAYATSVKGLASQMPSVASAGIGNPQVPRSAKHPLAV